MSLFDDFLRLTRPVVTPPDEDEIQPVRWRPHADVYRTHQGWLIKVELAGVRQEDVRVSASGRRLKILGKRRDWGLESGCQCHALEISYSHFEREFELPCELPQATIHWEYRDGMLLVRIVTEGAKS